MRVNVTKSAVSITEFTGITAGEFGVNSCIFTLPECFDGLTVIASFNNIPVPVTDGECLVPSLPKGNVLFGVYAYEEEDGSITLMYSPKPTSFYVEEGSYSETTANESAPLPSVYEQYLSLVQSAFSRVNAVANGKEDVFRVDTLPEPSAENAGQIYQFIGSFGSTVALQSGYGTPEPCAYSFPGCSYSGGQFLRVSTGYSSRLEKDETVTSATVADEGTYYVENMLHGYDAVTLPGDFSADAVYYKKITDVPHYFYSVVHTENIVSQITAACTNSQVPGAKAIKDYIDAAIAALNL